MANVQPGALQRYGNDEAPEDMAQFKAKLSLEVLHGETTIQQIAAKLQVHLMQVDT